MNKTRLMIAVLFIIAFVAGIASTVAVQRWQEREPQRPHRESWLADQLDLTPEQQTQMREIWSGIGRDGGREAAIQRHELSIKTKNRWRELVPAEKRDQFDDIYEQYMAQRREHWESRRRHFTLAVDRTRQILTPAQREKYEQIRSRGFGWRGPDADDRGGPPESTEPVDSPDVPDAPAQPAQTQPAANGPGTP